MKLRESQRSKLAERLATLLIARRGERCRRPKIYVINHSRKTAHVWGTCYTQRGYLVLHIGALATHRDKFILLVHELSHWVNDLTSSRRWQRHHQPHGERFQRILWGMLPMWMWARASRGQWIGQSSAHRVEYQPIDFLLPAEDTAASTQEAA